MTKRENLRVRSMLGFNPNKLPTTFDSDLCIKDLEQALTKVACSVKEQVALKMYLSKYMDDELVSAEEKRHAAILKWQTVEHLNNKTNQRLYLSQHTADFGWVTSSRILSYMRALIARTLGRVPMIDELRFSITNGASTRVYKGYQACYQKVSGEMHCSSSAMAFWLAFASGSFFGESLQKTSLITVDSSVLLTVPKKTEIDRVIATEPECNAILQRALGLRIRARLLKVGLDLRDQTRNQELAHKGSRSGKLATIDFSSASDTLTTQLVTLLMPPLWYELLSAARVSDTLVDGVNHEFELWSSMGNGYTFELETLIFWALASAVCYFSGVKGEISVYGDDVILPTKAARRYMRIARWFGFMPNEAKSFVDGHYRESCGRHYYRGRDVTPFFIRGPLMSYHDLIGTLNQILEWNCRGYGFFVDESVFHWWKRWSVYIPSFLKGGWDPMDPGVLVDGNNAVKRRIVSRTEDVRLVVEIDSDESHSSVMLLSIVLGGQYSEASRPLSGLKLAKNESYGTVSYTPGLIFEA